MSKSEIEVNHLYSILNEFKGPECSIEQKIYRKICNFNNKKFGQKIPKDSEYFYEQIAFAFMEGGNPPLEWGDTFYSPLSGQKEFINKQWTSSYPAIQNITPKMIDYWKKRSSVSNPILQCRYAGLIWDFSKKIRNLKPDISIAHRFIDSVIKMADLGGEPFLKDKLERALKLSVSINDKQRIISVRDAIIKYEVTHSEDDRPGTWGYSYDLLIGDKNLYRKVELDREQEDKIINELERKLKIFSDKDSNTFKPHYVEYIVTKLAPYYKDKNDMTNMKRILLTYKSSFLYNSKNISAMVGSDCLEKVRSILFQYGLPQDAKELEKDIHILQKETLKEFKPISVSVPLPKEEIKKYIAKLDASTLFEGLMIIAINFIPNKAQAKDIVFKTAKEFPLQFLVSQSIMDHTGRVVAKVGPIKNDLEGHVVRQISQSIEMNLYFIREGLYHLEKSKSLNANLLSEYLFQSPIFSKEYHKIIEEGLRAFFNKNYILSCSTLIPQIESAVRKLISGNGGEIYQPAKSSNETGFVLRPLNSLLRDEIFIRTFKQNENISDYFQVLLTDKRGFNLRNMICHGHFPSTHFNEGIAIHIIHILLILSLLIKTE